MISNERLSARWRLAGETLARAVAMARGGQRWEEALSGIPFVDEVAGGRDLRCAPLSGAALSGADLRRADLSGADLSSASLARAELDEAALVEANLRGADLSDAAARGATFDRADLERAKLCSADLTESSFIGASLIKVAASDVILWTARLAQARLDGATLERANLYHADLTSAQAPRALLEGACLEGIRAQRASFGKARLFSARMAGAELGHANFSEAKLDGADLSGADLSGANLFGASLKGVNLTGCLLTGAYLKEAQLTGADLSFASLGGAQLVEAVLDDAVLTRALMRNAVLTSASLRRADLRDARLWSADLQGAVLADAVAEGVDLEGAKLVDADLSGADLGGANCRNTLWNNARVHGARLEQATLSGSSIYSAQGLESVHASTVDLGDSPSSRADKPWYSVLERARALREDVHDKGPPASPSQLSAGGTLGRYVIEEKIGEGGMGQVFRALDTRLGRRVALKTLIVDPNEPTNAERVSRLEREARVIALLSHPNAVQVHDVGEDCGRPFIAMELIVGRPLSAFVGRPVPGWRTRVRWLRQVAEALSAAHGIDIVHRDVKPANVMIREDGNVKVLDFGIARSIVGSGKSPQLLPTLTSDGAMGTPAYMSPEHVRGEPLDGRSDQFSWAVTAYEVLYGALPWTGTPYAVLAKLLSDPAPPLCSLLPDLPLAISDVVNRAQQKAREARFASMDEIVEALGPYADDTGDERIDWEELLPRPSPGVMSAATLPDPSAQGTGDVGGYDARSGDTLPEQGSRGGGSA